MARQISYAQRYEDMHLLRAFGGQQNGFYIDIGAGHPVYDNVSFAFYLRGWRSVTGRAQPLARATKRGGAAARYPHPVARRGRAGRSDLLSRRGLSRSVDHG